MTCFFTLRHSRSVNTFQDEWNTQTLPAAGSHFLAQPSQCSGTPTLLPSPSPMHLIRPSIPPTRPKDYQLTYVRYAEQVLTFRAATEDFIELIPLLSKKPAAQIATTTSMKGTVGNTTLSMQHSVGAYKPPCVNLFNICYSVSFIDK